MHFIISSFPAAPPIGTILPQDAQPWRISTSTRKNVWRRVSCGGMALSPQAHMA
jgi:hypothetical protein